MKTKFSQKYLQSMFFKILLGVILASGAYNLFFYILDYFDLPNKFTSNIITILFTVVGFYFSIIPIKILSTLFPDWYYFTQNIKYPVSKDLWVFVIEQISVILFTTLTIFSVYLMVMWGRRFYKMFTGRAKIVEWSRFSIAIGIASFIYYILMLGIVLVIANSFRS